jgi:hypothetical protein
VALMTLPNRHPMFSLKVHRRSPQWQVYAPRHAHRSNNSYACIPVMPCLSWRCSTSLCRSERLSLQPGMRQEGPLTLTCTWRSCRSRSGLRPNCLEQPCRHGKPPFDSVLVRLADVVEGDGASITVCPKECRGRVDEMVPLSAYIEG